MALRPISRIPDYAFPPDAWDVRGWVVRTESDEAKVGHVDDLLLDRRGGLRYLDVDLGKLRRHILIPLDHAFAERESTTVWVEGVSRDEIEAVPEYTLDPEDLDEAFERRIDAAWGGTAASRQDQLVADTPEGEAEVPLRRLTDLSDEYRVAGDDPRGWHAVTGDGRAVGKVIELLVDTGAMRAAYLDVALDERALELEPIDRHVLMPAGRVRFDRAKRRVIVGGLLAGDLRDYPQYRGLPLQHQQARELDAFYDSVASLDRAEPFETREEGPVPEEWEDRTLRHFYRARPRSRRTPTEE